MTPPDALIPDLAESKPLPLELSNGTQSAQKQKEESSFQAACPEVFYDAREVYGGY